MDWRPITIGKDNSVSIPKRWLLIHYFEALNILFRTENSLRVFVYVILKNRLHDKWQEAMIKLSESEQYTIESAAAKRIAQAKSYGYLCYDINSHMMQLSSGELTKLITSEAYWPHFKPYFKARKDIIITKLEEVGTVRNSLAHFRPIKYDDVELIKQNIKHTLLGVEACLSEIISTYTPVPTNTVGEWYKMILGAASELCSIGLFQSKKDEWIRVEIEHRCDIIRAESYSGGYESYTVLKLMTPSLIRKYKSLAKYSIFLYEVVQTPHKNDTDNPEFKKSVSIVLSKKVLTEHYKDIASDLSDAMREITEETSLLKADNLARGELIETSSAYAFRREENNTATWVVGTGELRCAANEDDPAEYWDDIGGYHSDFIAGIRKYPWMPSDISQSESPFD